MPDHIAAVREQAEKEAERRWPVPFVGRAAEMEDFTNGAVWVASRLTREKIADAITNRPTGQSAADAVLGLLERGDETTP